MNPPCALFDPARHEPLAVATWDEAAARAAIARIVDAAEREFDEAGGHWPMHPRDEPLVPGAPSYNLYWGASGTVWALLQLQAAGRVRLRRDYAAWIPQYPARVHEEAATEQHGSASYLFGETGPLLLAWRHTRSPAFADRIHTLVRDNLHNPAHEPLWGNAGTVLAAIGMAESCRDARWPHLVRDAVQALLDDMVIDPGTGPGPGSSTSTATARTTWARATAWPATPTPRCAARPSPMPPPCRRCWRAACRRW